MLKRVSVITYIVIIIVWISKKLIFFGKNIAGADIWARQFGLKRVADLEDVLFLVLEVSAHFIAQVWWSFPGRLLLWKGC